MPNPRETIAVALLAHEWIDTQSLCACGWNPDEVPTADHFDHVAGAVLAALELRQEERTLTDGWIQPTRNAMYYAQGLTPPPAEIVEEHRFVTPWRSVHE